MTELRIPTRDGGHLAAEHHTARSDELTSATGRPCVVMAHGVGATRDCGLSVFAEALAEAGVDVIAFDYRHFAGSSGSPRQVVDLKKQVEDYHTAISHARNLVGVDPGRIVVWGVSLSGGHVLEVTAADPALAGVVSVTPAVDGLAAVAQMRRANGIVYIGRLLRAGIADAVAAIRNRPPVTVPIVGHPGEVAALSSPPAVDGMLAIAGPTWRNHIAARILLTIGTYRPTRVAKDVRCPTLMQIATGDQSAPAPAAVRAATRMRATVRHYPCDHFDVYPGATHHESIVAHQIAFLRRLLARRVDSTSAVNA